MGYWEDYSYRVRVCLGVCAVRAVMYVCVSSCKTV